MSCGVINNCPYGGFLGCIGCCGTGVVMDILLHTVSSNCCSGFSFDYDIMTIAFVPVCHTNGYELCVRSNFGFVNPCYSSLLFQILKFNIVFFAPLVGFWVLESLVCDGRVLIACKNCFGGLERCK